MPLFNELKGQNVLRIAGPYLLGAWLFAQVTGTVLPIFEAPAWLPRTIVVVAAVSFTPALIFAWAFELTPEGLKRESEVDVTQSIAHVTGHKLDRTITAVLITAVSYFASDNVALCEELGL